MMSVIVVGPELDILHLINDPAISYLKTVVQPQSHNIDIVAVHGLNIPINGKAWKAESFGINTWVSDDPNKPGNAKFKKLWLKDFLPESFPRARVMVFGYNSNVGLNTSTAGVAGAADDLLAKLRHKRRDINDRPILFLCHSLGGIVVKLAVSKARSNPQYKDLYPQIRSIAFFATPHRGGLHAELGQAAAGGLRRLTGNVRSSVMEALRHDSFIAPEIHRSFTDCLSDDYIHICSFYEAKPIRPLVNLVVDQNSAVLGLEFPKEVRYLVPESTHSSICKFGSKDENYEVIVDFLADLVDYALGNDTYSSRSTTESTLVLSRSRASTVNGRTSLDEPQEVRPTSNYLGIAVDLHRSSSPFAFREEGGETGPWFVRPNIGISKFVGRELLLDLTKEALTHHTTSQIRVALHGLGGVGKTQMALQIAEWYHHSFPQESIFWLRASNITVFSQSLEDVAAQLNITSADNNQGRVLQSVQKHLLNERNGRWLIIADNADNYDSLENPSRASSLTAPLPSKLRRIPIAMMIPRCVHGRVLFTTNSKIIANQLVAPEGHLIEIGPMSQEESRTLLQRHLDETTPSGTNPLGYQPIVPSKEDLQFLATHLNNLPLAIAQAAAFMRQQSLTVADYLRIIASSDASLSDLIDHDFQGYGIEHEFSKAMVTTWNAAFDSIEREYASANDLLSFMAFLEPQSIPKSLLKVLQPDERELNAISLGTLQAYALVTLEAGSEIYNMHRLVQLAIRKRLETKNITEKTATTALRVLAKAFPDKEDQDLIFANGSKLLSHALHVLKNQFIDSYETNTLASTLSSNLSHYYNCQGNYNEAVRHSKTANCYLEKVSPLPRKLILSNQTTEVWALREFGKTEEAMKLANTVWLGNKKEYGSSADITVMSHLAISLIYLDLGRYKECFSITKECVKVLQRTHKENDLPLLRATIRLGRSHYFVGNFAESERLLNESLDIAIQQIGAEHVETLKLRYRIAYAVLELGRAEECDKMCSDIWTTQKVVLGEQHPDTMKTLNLKGIALLELGDKETALRYHRRIYRRALEQLGPDHRYTRRAGDGVADVLSKESEDNRPTPKALEEAEKMYRHTVDYSSFPGIKHHPDTLRTQSNLANVLRLQGKFSEAEKLQVEAYKELKGALGKQHPFTLNVLENLTLCLKDVGKEKKAVKRALAVLEGREKALGWDHYATLRAAKLVLELEPNSKKSRKLRDRLAGVNTEKDSALADVPLSEDSEEDGTSKHGRQDSGEIRDEKVKTDKLIS